MPAGGRVRCATLVLAALMLAADATAAVFPRRPRSQSTGLRDSVYLKLRSDSGRPMASFQIAQIRELEAQTREFYAVNSGGQYDIRFTHILDVPLALNSNGARPDDWFGLGENYVRSNYGIEPEDFHLNLFDVSSTEPDADQGWSGIAVSPGNNIAVQPDITSDWGKIVVDHELGHHIGAPHSGAYRAVSDNNYTPYVWDGDREQYREYSTSRDGLQPTTFGVHLDGYGNPYSVMGNISHEHFSIIAKHDKYGWLSDEQVPELTDLGEGTYRIYAHDELLLARDETFDYYGVEETYAADKLYGLRYTRKAERFNTSTRRFEPYNQELTLEYRSGRDGVQFYMGEAILDMDLEGGTDRNNGERELEVGQSISDLAFGTSVFWSDTEGEDFLSFNPPAPTDPWELNDEWYEFSVLGTSSDEVGSYIELSVTRLSQFPITLAGDYNDDGIVDAADYTTWRDNLGAPAGTLPNDPTGESIGDDQYAAWRENFGAIAGGSSAVAAVPEPAGVTLAAFLALGGAVYLRR